LLEWQLRLALKNEDWRRVRQLCYYHTNHQDPMWMYWKARALAALGNTQEAHLLYQETAKNRHYYGFLASQRIHQPPEFEAQMGMVNLTSLRIYQPFTERIRALHHQQRDLEASVLLNDFISELPLNDKITLIHWVSNVLQWYPRALALSSADEFKNYLILRFPLGFKPIVQHAAQHYQVPEALLYAVIRQESAFNPKIASRVGARGLMQLMPSTAKLVAQTHHIPYRELNELNLPVTNIMLGTAYLQSLGVRFDHHPMLMAAAYNAGPSQVNYWLKHHPPKEVDLWIETLPWKETRNYLKNVIAFYAIYQYRMQQSANLEPAFKTLPNHQ
jgi:soluble lytic murein transglycosylase